MWMMRDRPSMCEVLRMVTRRLRRVVGMAVGALILTGAPAFADPLPSSTAPLPGSAFQGGDGNQDDAAPSIDWQALQAAGRVVHAPDDNANDTAFAGGSKILKPGEWDVTIEPGGVIAGQGQHPRCVGRGRPAGGGHVPVPRLHARGRDRNRGDRLRAQPRRAALGQRPGQDPVSQDRRRVDDHSCRTGTTSTSCSRSGGPCRPTRTRDARGPGRSRRWPRSRRGRPRAL